ncbi:MAG: N-6 DNA methylase [Candidatus Moranbacteria bacterium]|nr:N-6 DNA methylase [Candidatus Moranbacteria bacterium]
MANGFAKNLIINNNEAVLNLESAATFLGISTATVRNWVKCGHLQTFEDKKHFFHKKDVEDIKSKILSGDLEKLNRRANKAKADKTFVPDEYAKDRYSFDELNFIVDFIKSNNIELFPALLLISLNLLKKEGVLLSVSIQDVVQKKDLSFTNKQIKEEIISWILEIDEGKIKEEFSFLLDCNIPKQRDVLGFLYQSLLLEGKKSQSGSYYTPSNIVDEIVADYAKRDSKVLDPCCGTGQFLLAFSDVVENPENIYGVDFDEIAVRIARLNLLIKFKGRDFAPNIVCKNTLFDIGNYDLFSLNDENIRNFDVIATNPPWGVHFSKEDSGRLKKTYPTITSLESFSYFLKKSLDLLCDGGISSFILPESILNVKTHKDIRGIILKNAQIKKITYLNRVFKNVFTPVIRLDFKKSEVNNGRIVICKENKSYSIEQTRWLQNQDLVFDIHASEFDAEIISKIYSAKHTTLENKADWALGIVTGNNKEFIADEPKDGFEPIYKGKDVEKFILDKPSSYIQFVPEKFQQVAPTGKYRAKEKLIYRFISKYLVFAYDDKQQLTLNSANIVIPKISNYPIKVIAALFNSSLYQFIFQKKFSSIKILRSHIEQLPLPLWNGEIFSEIIELVDGTMNNEGNFMKLDNYIMDKFTLSSKEKDYINEFNK